MGLYDKPQVVNPTLRSQGSQINGWVDQTAQQMPALNPAAVSGPSQIAPLPPQASQIAIANRQRGQQGGNIHNPRLPTKIPGMEQPVPGNTGIVPPHLNPNSAPPVGIPPATNPNIGGFAAWQNFQPQRQDWRATRPDTAGMTEEQAQAAVQGWFNARPATPGFNQRPVGIQPPVAPRWPGARPQEGLTPSVAPTGFAADPMARRGRIY